ncbi:gliding motility protein GldD [Parabacteroides sp. PF5-9]|uniref:gliding motility lipoprotein GldD n=1 Tax=Parabacteroides sp. PF5-9 TaxID=1742404 RepID=UPI0024730A3D|nr:gliding motility protein GldD [Parabacteroides sp. PF5-9]MDH6358666.1 gliding motility-associated lipoprotein GldD [Parabacteroides sp. PF5-9]
MKRILLFCSLYLICISCSEYTPKPRGYVRIEPSEAQYTLLQMDELPYSFHISNQATVELPAIENAANWINVAYPSLNARIYCSYFQISPPTFSPLLEESRELVERSARNSRAIAEQAYNDPENALYASLFLLDGESASPVQFILTDSMYHFFRGALYYDVPMNVDSLAPLTAYLKEDIIELIQSFSWKK